MRRFVSSPLCFVLYFTTTLVVVCSAAVGSDHGAASLSEWESLVERTVAELRTKRSVIEPEYRIDNLHSHYASAFEGVNTLYNRNRYPSIQDYGHIEESQGGDTQSPVDGRYIVMLQSSVSDDYLDHTIRVLERANANSDGRLVAKHIKPFRTVGKGFTATLGSTVVRLMAEHPERYTIEQDMALKRHSHDEVSDQVASMSSSSVPWNLDRLDQHDILLDGQYNPLATGQGVDVYILDTGIRYTHNDLENRVRYAGYDAIDELVGTQNKGNDCNSHGTHCAGTVGGKKYGVAKKVTLYAARVLDCTGTGAVSGIIHTMEFIVKNRKENGHTNRAVFSMSLGVEKSDAFNTAANLASSEGVVVVAASGNQGKNSCDYSPGSATQAISVAASDMTDSAVSFSNLGECVTVFAPGASIQSASNKCDSCTMTKSGTSMACPHAAGLAAIYLSLDPSLKVSEVKSRIAKQATKDAIKLSTYSYMMNTDTRVQESTPNLLLYVESK